MPLPVTVAHRLLVDVLEVDRRVIGRYRTGGSSIFVLRSLIISREGKECLGPAVGKLSLYAVVILTLAAQVCDGLELILELFLANSVIVGGPHMRDEVFVHTDVFY